MCAEFGGTQAHPGEVESQFELSNAVQRPQITSLGREVWPNFSDKAASLVFALLQKKPFRGGNKRVALASLIAFCELNGKTLDAKVFDEKTAESLFKKAVRDSGVPPENAFGELREVMSRSIA